MKGRNLCYGLLLALLITFGLSFVGCSNTNAYKYQLTHIPFVVPNSSQSSYFSSAPVPKLYLPLSFQSTDSFSLNNSSFWYYDMEYRDGNCVYVRYRSAADNLTIPSFYIPFYYGTEDYYSSDISDIARCNKDTSLNNISTNSIPPYVFGNPNLRSFVPYRYAYSGVYLTGGRNQEGFISNSRLDFATLFEDNDMPDSFSNITIPFGYSRLHFDEGEEIKFHFQFYFTSTSDPTGRSMTLGSDFNAEIIGDFYEDADDYRTGGSLGLAPNGTSCEYSRLNYHLPTAEDTSAPFMLELICTITSPKESNISGFTLRMTGNPVFSYPGLEMMILDTFDVFTNVGEGASLEYGNDPTGMTFQDSVILGNYSDEAPGSGNLHWTNDVSSNGVNWSQTFSNLFNFSFFNPFAPLFGLFMSQDRCVQIPTLASMLHSNESSVCPWFSSSIRSIVTPVLGISSVMLLFGFVVRWLGSRSGNFIEDSGGVDAGGFHFENKFRRKG